MQKDEALSELFRFYNFLSAAKSANLTLEEFLTTDCRLAQLLITLNVAKRQYVYERLERVRSKHAEAVTAQIAQLMVELSVL